MGGKNKEIIAFSGRLGSGKTELASICEKYGYERLYFAKPLKVLIANLIGGTIDDVNRLKKGDTFWIKEIGAVDCIFLSQQTQIPLDIIKEKLLHHTFTNTRDMLQIIGTDLIREHNPNWHVERTIAMIEEGKKYVIDDVRFTNEKKAIEDLGGDVWFVVRPNFDIISHHISEETLKWQDFENVIVNSHNLAYFQMIWNIFMENGYNESKEIREKELEKLFNDKEYRNEFLKNDDLLTSLNFLQISKDFFTYSTKYRNNTEIAKVTKHNDKELVVEWSNISMDDNIVKNALEIEDLKIYL